MKAQRFIAYYSILLLLTIISLNSCDRNHQFRANFDGINDRIWIGEEFWAIPVEDWHLKDGKIETLGDRVNMRVNILTAAIEGEGSFNFSVQMGLLKDGKGEGSGGIRLGIKDETDSDYRSLCYFGQGINIGVNGNRMFFLCDTFIDLPPDFNLSSFVLRVKGENSNRNSHLTADITDPSGKNVSLKTNDYENLDGMISLVSNHTGSGHFPEGPKFWYDNISFSGNPVTLHPEREFGPVFWTMYTLSRGTLKMTAQMPPVSQEDPKEVLLQMKNENSWIDLSNAEIDPEARIAVFKVPDWDASKEHSYRISYELDGENHYYDGKIRMEPDNGKLKMAGMTCQYHYGFPYRPLVENLETLDPDLLYFSGDQIYEGNGGYGIIRFPADQAILNYLGKWYMFGWAFGELMRDRPTIVIPDDHEVYQGNLWGAGGKKVSPEEWAENTDCTSGFVEPAEMVNVVMHTNCAHLPDPFDPTPMKQDIDVYYTDLIYGGVSFAIVGDRIFKSGPENVSFWSGRKDHIKQELEDPSILDRDDLKFLGDRQMKFINHWIDDWAGCEMKVLLSQTIFTNAATHHGANKMFLYGDMDSGGWPKSGRDRALKAIRKAFAFHISGDQHLPTFIQYGIENYRDAGWAFCTPAITVGYQRRFQPDRLSIEVKGRPEHNNPNTGLYTDVFGNPNYVYAVGNPVDEANDENRYLQAQKRSSGFGLINFDLEERTIESHAYRFLADLSIDSPDNQFPGWPVTISQIDNYGKEYYGYLPDIKFENLSKPVVRVINEDKSELVYSLRIKGKSFSPFVFEPGNYSIIYGNPEIDNWNHLTDLRLYTNPGKHTILIDK